MFSDFFDILGRIEQGEFIGVFKYTCGNEFIDKLKELRYRGKQIRKNDYILLRNKKKIIEEITHRYSIYAYDPRFVSRGVIIILALNDINYVRYVHNFILSGRLNEKKVVKKDIIESQDPSDCTICLEVCSENDSFKLDCACKFSCHKECIEKWLSIKQTCPFCKI